jgi:hypothetical protein
MKTTARILLLLVGVVLTLNAAESEPEGWKYRIHYEQGKMKLEIPGMETGAIPGGVQIRGANQEWKAVTDIPSMDAYLVYQENYRGFTLHSSSGEVKSTVTGPRGTRTVSRGFPGGSAEFKRICDPSSLNVDAVEAFDDLSKEEFVDDGKTAWRATPTEGMVITVMEDPVSRDMHGIMEFKEEMVSMVYQVRYEAVDRPATPDTEPEAGPTSVAKNAMKLTPFQRDAAKAVGEILREHDVGVPISAHMTEYLFVTGTKEEGSGIDRKTTVAMWLDKNGNPLPVDYTFPDPCDPDVDPDASAHTLLNFTVYSIGDPRDMEEFEKGSEVFAQVLDIHTSRIEQQQAGESDNEQFDGIKAATDEAFSKLDFASVGDRAGGS